MRALHRWILAGSVALLSAILLLLPLGCSQDVRPPVTTPGVPSIRVLLLENTDRMTLAAAGSPVVSLPGLSPSPLDIHGSTLITRAAGQWKIGGQSIGTGELILQPPPRSTLAINGKNYRGRMRLVASGADRFHVVNDVDVESYLLGVLSRELPRNWDDRAYMAQAIVARTYTIYEARTTPPSQCFDVYDDQRSLVYGGYDSETAKSRNAVNRTSGIVVTYGKPGEEKIFRAYFSSCCGGVTQSSADAFGDPFIEPLSDQNVGPVCSASTRFNWGPIVIKKAELTRRFRLFGLRRNRDEQNMADVTHIDVQKANRFGRPVRFVITDSRGTRYSWTGEEIRWAVNTDAQPGTTLSSSFFKLVNDADSIHFVEGHGFGHGVGMCQWCAQARAEAGMKAEDIVLAAFPRAKLKMAY